tara:strand:- start:2115 stop:2321 length:207 start_codon:yes stop_codon:yes gene_type:complete
MECIICGNPIGKDPSGWEGGHNAYPLMEGRCCGTCNDTLVIQARLKQMGYSTKQAGEMAKGLGEANGN